MLRVLRKKGVMKVIMWVIAIVIIVVFGFMGEAYLLRDQKTARYAGEVFGEKISSREYQNHLAQVALLARLQYGEDLDKIREFLDLEKEAWDHIILSKETDRRNIRVSNQEVIDEIKGYPFFYRDNRFDQTLYQDILRYRLGLSPADFESLIRQRLKIRKLFNEQTADVAVPEEAVLDAYKFENAEVAVEYTLVDSKQFTSQVQYDEIKAKDFYIQNKLSFIQPPAVNVAYVRVPYPQGDEPTDEEERKQAEETVDRLTQRLFGGEDIRTAAEALGLPVGESGFFTKEQPKLQPGWTFPLVEKIFRFNEGEVLGPVRTPDHLQVLVVKEKRPRLAPEYAEVKDEVAQAWKEQRASELAKEKAEELRKALQEQLSQNSPVSLAGLGEVKETPLFKRGTYLPEVGLSQEFQQAAFALTEENPIGGPVKTAKGWAVLRLKERAPLDMEQYAKEKDRIEKELIDAAKERAFDEYVARLRIRANLQSNTGQEG